MRKQDFTADFSTIKRMCSKIRNINEAMSYADEYDDDQDQDYGQGQQMPQQQQGGQMPQGFNPQGGDDSQMQMQGGYGQDDSGMQGGFGQGMMDMDDEDGEDQELSAEADDPDSPVNQIREIALKGMVALCKTPEDPQYEVLKKIFQFCDKANDKKKDEDEK